MDLKIKYMLKNISRQMGVSYLPLDQHVKLIDAPTGALEFMEAMIDIHDNPEKKTYISCMSLIGLLTFPSSPSVPVTTEASEASEVYDATADTIMLERLNKTVELVTVFTMNCDMKMFEMLMKCF